MVIILTYETRQKPDFGNGPSLIRNVPQNAISAASVMAMCFADRPP